MTSQEIRDERTSMLSEELRKSLTVQEGLVALQVRALYEIAAQLAQLNEGMEYLTERPIRVQVETGNYPLEVNTHERR